MDTLDKIFTVLGWMYFASITAIFLSGTVAIAVAVFNQFGAH